MGSLLKIVMFHGVCVDIENLEVGQFYVVNDLDTYEDKRPIISDNTLIITVQGGVVTEVANLMDHQEYEIVEE